VASGVFWGFAGFAFTHLLLTRVYSPGIARRAVLAGALGLPLGYYVWVEPTMAHATGFGVATLHVLSAWTWSRRVWVVAPTSGAGGWAFLTGLTLGVACSVRLTNVALGAVPLIVALTAHSSAPEGGRIRWPAMIRAGSLFVAGAAVGFLPQVIAWKVVYGAFVVDSYAVAGETWSAWPGNLLLVLFGLRNGLFTWTPLAVVAVAGVVWGVRERPLCRAGAIVLLVTAWIYGGWATYWLGSSFGMRGFVDVSFFLLLGLAEVLARVSRLPVLTRRAGTVLLVASLAWTLHVAVCYRAQIQPHGQPLVLKPLVTEWRLWARQLYNDTGVKVLIRQLRPQRATSAGGRPSRGGGAMSRRI
jgi:hypothetical protein